MKIEGPEELLQFMELMDVIQAIRDAMRQYFRNKIREYNFDITFEMIEVLIVLWKEDGRNQQEIADAVRKNKASLTSLIDNLSARQLVARRPDPNDRRNNIISLTREGIAYQARVTPLIREFYETFQQDFPDLELDQINKLLGRFYEQIQEKGNNT